MMVGQQLSPDMMLGQNEGGEQDEEELQNQQLLQVFNIYSSKENFS